MFFLIFLTIFIFVFLLVIAVIYSKEVVNKKELSKNTYFENVEYGLSSTNNQNVLLEII